MSKKKIKSNNIPGGNCQHEHEEPTKQPTTELGASLGLSSHSCVDRIAGLSDSLNYNWD
jgi:hypothetical protein